MLAKVALKRRLHDTFQNTIDSTIMTAERQVQDCVVFLLCFWKKKSEKTLHIGKIPIFAASNDKMKDNIGFFS